MRRFFEIHDFHIFFFVTASDDNRYDKWRINHSNKFSSSSPYIICLNRLHTNIVNRKSFDGIRGGSGGGFDKGQTTNGSPTNGSGSNHTSGTSGSGGSNNKDKNFLCPNCGNVCTQIEEFLCEYN